MSLTAEVRFQAPVPATLINMISVRWSHLHGALKRNPLFFCQELSLLKTGSASWSRTFGALAVTNELFMAYQYTLYVKHVARVGRKSTCHRCTLTCGRIMPMKTTSGFSPLSSDADGSRRLPFRWRRYQCARRMAILSSLAEFDCV